MFIVKLGRREVLKSQRCQCNGAKGIIQVTFPENRGVGSSKIWQLDSGEGVMN